MITSKSVPPNSPKVFLHSVSGIDATQGSVLLLIKPGTGLCQHVVEVHGDIRKSARIGVVNPW